MKKQDASVRIAANDAVSESREEAVAYPQPEPLTKEAPAPAAGGQAPEFSKEDPNKLPETEPIP